MLNNNVYKLKDSNIKVLLPEGYNKTDIREFFPDVDDDGSSVAVKKETSNAINIIVITKATLESAYNFTDADKLINDFNSNKQDNEILLKVESGVFKDNKYIYSIIKLQDQEEPRNRYLLNIYLGNEEDIVTIQGVFIEQGTTGMRDSIGAELARRAGLIKLDGDNPFEGWTYDPINRSNKEGVLMNLSEKEGLDGLFADHPLSHVRELIKAVLENKYLVESDKKEENPTADEKELILNLFQDKCLRKEVDIDLED